MQYSESSGLNTANVITEVFNDFSFQPKRTCVGLTGSGPIIELPLRPNVESPIQVLLRYSHNAERSSKMHRE